mmetsp:Transcript_19072/g.37451  ORF Transcript_19072/g.37451 Transcript_19072/m.37451 type:complete len:385 (+) Transcript_19072:265-1419(+)
MGADVVDQAIRGAQAAVPGWAALPQDGFDSEVVTGGLTNRLMLITISSDTEVPEEALVAASEAEATGGIDGDGDGFSTMALIRIFGEGTDDFIDRAVEMEVCDVVAEAGIAPRVLGHFYGGRAEEFITNAHSLVNKELHQDDILAATASLMAQMHSIHISEQSAEILVPEPTTPQILAKLYEAAKETSFDPATHPYKAAKLACFEVDKLADEVRWLEDQMAASGMGVVLCHRDLQSGNVMIRQNEDGELERAYLIDFEYGGMDYCGFDFGNTFNEMSINNFSTKFPGFNLDVDMYPTPEQQHLFFESYLDSFPDPERLFADGDVPDTREGMIERLIEFARIGTLASHLQWILWGIAQAGASTIEFGHLEYSMCRYDQYRVLRGL